MRIAFVSDIHGNAVALQEVLEDIKGKMVDRICVLGDLCFRGPEPKKSLEIVRALNCEVIKGNADEWIVRGVRKGEVSGNAYEMMNKERDWAFSQLDGESVEYLVSLPTELKIEYDDIKIHAFHATPSSLFDVAHPYESDEALIEKMMGNEADVYIYAHIHKPFIRYINGKCLINTGSVGLPFDGINKASYSLVEIDEEGFQTSIVRVNYEIEKVIKQLQATDYPNAALIINILNSASI